MNGPKIYTFSEIKDNTSLFSLKLISPELVLIRLAYYLIHSDCGLDGGFDG